MVTLDEIAASDGVFAGKLADSQRELASRRPLMRSSIDETVIRFAREKSWDDLERILVVDVADAELARNWSCKNVYSALNTALSGLFQQRSKPANAANEIAHPVITRIDGLELLALSRMAYSVMSLMEGMVAQPPQQPTLLNCMTNIAPGLTAFVQIGIQNYRCTGASQSEAVLQTVCLADIVASEKHLGEYSPYIDMQLYVMEQAKYRQAANRIIVAMGEAKEEWQLDALMTNLVSVYAQLEQLTKKINALLKEEEERMLGIAEKVKIRMMPTMCAAAQ